MRHSPTLLTARPSANPRGMGRMAKRALQWTRVAHASRRKRHRALNAHPRGWHGAAFLRVVTIPTRGRFRAETRPTTAALFSPSSGRGGAVADTAKVGGGD